MPKTTFNKVIGQNIKTVSMRGSCRLIIYLVLLSGVYLVVKFLSDFMGAGRLINTYLLLLLESNQKIPQRYKKEV
ncbi:hypothetical protein I6E78_11000 [Pseudoalteromonas sp. NZS127]|uniref:hypothetical protein n=1 Tax=unclassified Pseudoalteromonas TaxID=194690 RepID=UPI0015C6D57F|nr:MULTISPECIES: hypothetical protein [unclassified Pseudoalteromonas]MBH0072501.1 hypothetical protein [Pseudoalteromonas sp. NZS127]NYR11080.1 hypothetical protein [Pseudoalteromonas sp. MIP2626]